MSNDSQKDWQDYVAHELALITPTLTELGFELENAQPHLLGERHLMHAVTTQSGQKLILIGNRMSDGQKVIIKATSDPDGIREIAHERKCRKVLQEIRFAYAVFHSPEELVFSKRNGCIISIQKFIEQEQTFLCRPLEEQFSLALQAFKGQESAHAATYEHIRLITNTFGEMDAREYIQTFISFTTNIAGLARENKKQQEVLQQAHKILLENQEYIQQYGGFLTHTDFVPHNFRVVDGEIFLLDQASLRFGNKYEGWARFLNFMTLYNPELEKILVEYVQINRTTEESVSLKMMRIFRLGEIIWYYTQAKEKSSGDLRTLNTARALFWTEILKAQLNDSVIDPTIVENYKQLRDSLRSPEEKSRQREIH
jgi:hypothetical protein